MDRLCQPQAAWTHLGNLSAGTLPELHGHEGGNVAAEAVDDACPLAQGLDLVVPECRDVVVEVDDVGPVAYVVAGLAVGLAEEELRVLLKEDGVGRGVVVHHINHALHALGVDGVHQRAEVVHRAVLGVDRAIVAIGVRAAERSLPVLLANGMDGHEPHDVGPQRMDTREVGNHGAKRALGRVVANEDGVDDEVADEGARVLCHADPFLADVGRCVRCTWWTIAWRDAIFV